ncbi:hypothetical protein GQ55_6G232000 [Panicum hallii var. hallii]|uniref:Carbonic anhydrase n=1 Tax=Panicum hallii var. hallii TaxID=1504633 RepID=A0A2T7D8J7_9POAL|nr:hypothetical protein GQ55_6G232000 [Panicum hallii var. hallii]
MGALARRRHLRHAVGALLAAAFLLSAAVPGARAQEETEDEREFSYVPGAANGPDRWGEIKPSWANCSRGRMQSPIDLSHDRATLVRSLGCLDYSYRPAEATMVNRGHDITVRFSGDAGRLVINGTAYRLRQLHWHTPSEHTVDGRRYDMELHLVHESAENKAAVIGIFYEVGAAHDPFLKKLEPAIKRVRDTRDREEPIGLVDPSGARATGSVYYRYMGSLTTPPCTEGVVWTVFHKVRPVDGYQVELLRDAVDDGNRKNARPLQAVNNRDISIFRPKPYARGKQYY